MFNCFLSLWKLYFSPLTKSLLVLILHSASFSAVSTRGWNDHPPAQVNQVHITQVAPHKYPLNPGAHPPRKTTRRPHKSHQKKESDADPVFSLDDFTDDCEPFFESEEDELSSSGMKTFILCIEKSVVHIHTRFDQVYKNWWYFPWCVSPNRKTFHMIHLFRYR